MTPPPRITPVLYFSPGVVWGYLSVFVRCLPALVVLIRAYLVYLSVRVSFIFPFPDATSGLVSSSKNHQGLFLFLEGR